MKVAVKVSLLDPRQCVNKSLCLVQQSKNHAPPKNKQNVNKNC